MVVDTSIFIEHLRSKDKSSTKFYKLADENGLFISAVSVYELYLGATSPARENELAKLISSFVIIPFNDEIAIKTAQIYQQLKSENKLIESRDIFIAASCITEQLAIATLNKKHFERIEGLVVV